MSDRPALRIVRGTPDDAEIAALTTALAGVAAASTAPASEGPRELSEWASRSSGLRRTGVQGALRPGPHAWRASALPQ